MVAGTRVRHVFSHVFHVTMVHLHDLGGRIAPTKSNIFASISEHRRWLESYIWPAINTNIEVVHHMSALGAALSTTYVCNTSLSRQRLQDAAQVLLRIAHLPYSMAHKIRFVPSFHTHMAFMGAKHLQLMKARYVIILLCCCGWLVCTTRCMRDL